MNKKDYQGIVVGTRRIDYRILFTLTAAIVYQQSFLQQTHGICECSSTEQAGGAFDEGAEETEKKNCL